MNSPSLPHNPVEEYDVIRSADSRVFGFTVLGIASVLAAALFGCLEYQFPAEHHMALWIGVAVTLAVIGVSFRGFLFARTQLQIRKDRVSIRDFAGKVVDEVHYSAIAAINLVERTVSAASQATMPRSLDSMEVEDVPGAPEESPPVLEKFLGIRFHEAAAQTLNGRQQNARARVRNCFEGCDWVLTADRFQAPLAVIEKKIRKRWQAFRALRVLAPSQFEMSIDQS
jgi:hypothetical protein